MTMPTPPGDSPLVEGLGPEWNDIVSAFPEDKRTELGPLLRDRVSSVTSQYEPLKAYEDFHKSGISPDQIGTALNLYKMIDDNPKQIYDAIGNALGLTQQQQDDLQDKIEEGDPRDPEIQALRKQVETMAQIMVTQHQQSTQAQQAAEADKALENEISAVKQKYGDTSPDTDKHLLMRMMHYDMSAEEAYQDYQNMVNDIRNRRPAPFVMGSGGQIPSNAIDPTKLNSKDTKNLVAQMLQHGNQS